MRLASPARHILGELTELSDPGNSDLEKSTIGMNLYELNGYRTQVEEMKGKG